MSDFSLNYVIGFRPVMAGKEYRLNPANAYQNGQHNTLTDAISSLQPVRVVERKIGRATFIVSSRFNDGNEKDIVSTIARLVQHDSGNGGKPE